jgi:hypothetical protein
MFDVFYFSDGRKPNLFPHERSVDSFQHAQKLSRTRFFWIVHYLADYEDWDWLFEPVPWQADQRHAWASQWQSDSGTYLVPRAGYEHTNYHTDRVITRLTSRDGWRIPPNIDADSFDFSWHPLPSEHYQHHFGTQWQTAGGPVYNLGADSVKLETAQHAVARPTNKPWTVPDGVEPVDQSWHPNPFDPPYIYQFGTQHQRTGGPVYTVSGATDIKYVDQIRATTNRVATAIYEIDHMCGSAGQIANITKTVRYFDNYRDTLIRIAKSIGDQHEFVWICSSICDYTNFDFSWHPEQWQATMLHVFASNEQKFGDTFFMHVPTFAVRAEKKELLEWYDVNFVDVRVPRRPMPVIVHNNDSQVDAIKNTEWSGPLATFTNHNYVPGTMAVVPLWREQTKAIVPISDGAATVVVPRTAVPYIRTQLYDYPYIDRSQRVLQDNLLDIVFISNGEPQAEFNFNHLKWVVEQHHNSKNRIHHVSGVNGRVNSQHAAAKISTTPWYFLVPGKLEVDDRFDWSWQPDRMQQPKHYIFHAHNPVNGLVYGHQAIVANNKKLTLNTVVCGLDFTMDSPHEVVPVISGTAFYAQSDWVAWRTAFREVIKLKAILPDVESSYRLDKWLTVDTSNGQWSMKGAEDAVEYYDLVNGDLDALKKSYEWSWLATYAFVKRNIVV